MALFACFVSASGRAEEAVWQRSLDGAAYAYVEGAELNRDSVLNPGNQIVRLPSRRQTVEVRPYFKAEGSDLRLTFLPIFQVQRSSNEFGALTQHNYYTSQGEARWRPTDSASVAAGRQILTWGPAQFRSPSNPFYFDAVHDNPQHQLSGLDVIRADWAPDTRGTLGLVYVIESSRQYLVDAYPAGTATDPWRDTWLIKGDVRGEDWAGGLLMAKTAARGAFVGAHLQTTQTDALLLYGELGSSTRTNALAPVSDATLPLTVLPESERHTNALFGLSYTLENSQTLSAEYLHHGHGFTGAQERAYFQRAANTPLPAGAPLLTTELVDAPPLLGQDYLHLIWQNSPLANDGYWRVMLTHNMNDGGSMLSAYGDRPLTGRITFFAMGVLPHMGKQQEFSTFIRSALTAGVKVALH